MKKTMTTIGLMFMTVCMFSACSFKPASESDTTAVVADTVDTTAAVAEENNVAEESEAPEADNNAFELQKEAAEAVFMCVLFPEKCTNSSEKKAKSYCTKSFLKELAKLYDYDDGGIAWYALRTPNQDGDGKSKIVSITPSGKTSVEVEYRDMGEKGVTILNFVPVDGSWKIDSAEVIYNGIKTKIG